LDKCPEMMAHERSHEPTLCVCGWECHRTMCQWGTEGGGRRVGPPWVLGFRQNVAPTRPTVGVAPGESAHPRCLVLQDLPPVPWGPSLAPMGGTPRMQGVIPRVLRVVPSISGAVPGRYSSSPRAPPPGVSLLGSRSSVCLPGPTSRLYISDPIWAVLGSVLEAAVGDWTAIPYWLRLPP